jgi:hypothetical protein
MTKLFLLFVAALVAIFPSAAFAAGHVIVVGKDCTVQGGTGGGHTPIVGPKPILNYEINDALLTALAGLKDSDPKAYAAFSASLAELPETKRQALTTGLGLSVTSSSVTRSIDYSLMLQMNSKIIQVAPASQ